MYASRFMKYYRCFFLGIFFQLIFSSCISNHVTTAVTESKETDSIVFIPQPPIPEDTLLSIIAVGDIMIGSAFPSIDYLPPDDAVNSFKKVKQFLKGDIIFGNLEGCLLNSGTPARCTTFSSPNKCYAFMMPERYAGIIKDAGFNVLSVANNHIGDFGDRGRKRTTQVLDSVGINYAGQLNCPYTLFEKNDIKYAFCAFSPNKNTLSITNLKAAQSLVKELKEQADIVIVSFHGGSEGANFERVTRKNEIYFSENRGNVYAFAHAVIDAGADIVLGHGPHVTRAVEVYKNKFIAYSLGNFCTYGTFSLEGVCGIAPLIQLKTNMKGDFVFADIVSVKQDKINGLQLDSAFAAFQKIEQLTNLDFEGHHLVFENNRITLKRN